MNLNALLQYLPSIVLVIVSVAITYSTFMLFHLPNKIEKQTRERVDIELEQIKKSLILKLKLFDFVLDDVSKTFKTKTDTSLYLASHIIRLASGSKDEKEKSMAAILGLGVNAAYALPIIENIRQEKNWTDSCEKNYLELINNSRVQ